MYYTSCHARDLGLAASGIETKQHVFFKCAATT